MGQGGSLNQNKSLILGNWIETKTGSNIFFNKVTNQQIQRYQVVINEKNQLSSYASRMQDQSGLICRLIYFHPKQQPKQDKLKKQHMKTFTMQNASNNRPKSMINENQPNQTAQNTMKKNISNHQQDSNTKIYCIYTDRMIPIKEWSRDKIMDVITAFKKLTKLYGMFKVRQRCICENERKQVKVWINQNPVCNVPVEHVESQQDMIADFAAILVSKKEKIAKQLLDMQYFDQAIDHFSKLSEHDKNDKKRYNIGSSNSTNTNSNRQSNTPTSQMQKQPGFIPLASQVNNFYNVYINTDNSYTVNSSMQNSKFNIVNQGNYSYSNFSQETNDKQQSAKYSQTEENSITLSQKYKTSNELNMNMNRQYSVPNFIQAHIPSYSQTPGFSSLTKVHQFNQENYVKRQKMMAEKQNPNQISINNVIRENKQKQKSPNESIISVDFVNFNLEQDHCMDNTSIMIQGDKKTTDVNKNLIKAQKSNGNVSTSINSTATHLQKNLINIESNPSIFFVNQNPKQPCYNPLNFASSTSNDMKNRSKNNSSGDIQVKKNLQSQQHGLPSQSFIHSQKKDCPQNCSSKISDKKFFSGSNKGPLGSQNYLKKQTASIYNLQKVSQFQQKSIDQGRFSEGLPFKHQQKNQPNNKAVNGNDLSSVFVNESKVFTKSGHPNEICRLNINYDSNRNVVSQMSTLKAANIQNNNTTNSSQINKKSFPKYFLDKQTSKSIQKYYEKSLQQREKSIILKKTSQRQKSPKKNEKGFGQQKFQYKISQQNKSTIQDIVIESQQNETCSKQYLPATQKFTHSNENFIRCPTETYEPRRKFPSTIESKNNKLIKKKSLQQKQFKKNNFGIEIDSQSSYVQSHEGTKEKFLDVSESVEYNEKILKKSNKTDIDEKQKMMENSYLGNINTNSSLLISSKSPTQKKVFGSDIKKRKKLQSMDKNQDQIHMAQQEKIVEGQTKYQQQNKLHKVLAFDSNTDSKFIAPFQNNKQIPISIDDSNRKQTFPHYQQNINNSRKNQKQFTFFNPSQKPSGLIHIEEINPFEPAHQKNRNNVFKKESLKSVDEKQTLPRTTADQKQKRMFKQTRTSQILYDANDLHSSDPGHRIEQIVQTLEKQKERMMMNHDSKSVFHQKIDNKQHPKFKKWEPSMNTYGSMINHVVQGASTKKKDYTTQSQKHQNSQQQSKSNQNETSNDQEYQSVPEMTSSDNLQTKKKIRKQVFMDYKGLFGDQNPFLKEESAEEKQKAKKLQLKKLRQQEERLLENASSKDLLIQQKVQKQKQKHAQLKDDLSKLFSEGF